MAPHSFVVFQDRSPRTPRQAAELILQELEVNSHSTSRYAAADEAEKENLNPATGECAGQPTRQKRKTSELATKSQVPLATKGQVDFSEATPIIKKQKTVKRRSASEKDRRPRKTGWKASERSFRRTPSLSKVEEERESEKEIERIRLADIDSRCYELTVKPLADLSEAFGCRQAFIPEGRATIRDDEMSMDKGCEFDFDPCDYLMPLPPTPPPTPIKSSLRHMTPFSTPERKLLFAAFTFSSPSPSAEKFKRVKSICRGSTRACSSP